VKRALSTAVFIAVALLLGACGEKPQTNEHGVRLDTAPWIGTGTQPNTGTAFTASGWTPGDRNSWEQHLKARMQFGQNDYTRIN